MYMLCDRELSVDQTTKSKCGLFMVQIVRFGILSVVKKFTKIK